MIDWGDGTVESINGDISQKVHTYASVGTFNVTIENIKSYAASTNSTDWFDFTSKNCWTLKEVVFPDSITSIGQYAFCEISLRKIVFSSSITTIESGAFYGSNLNGAIIPSSVVSINGWAFPYALGDGDSMTFDGRTISQVQSMINYDFGISDGSPGDAGKQITINCSDGSFTITTSCILKGTDILLSDGTTKKIEDLTYDDVLKVWDFDEGQLGSAKVCWLTRPGLKNWHYYQLTFDNGTVLKTTGINSNHRIFSVDQSKFTNVCDAKAGDKVFSIDGTLTITDVQYVEEECEYYNVMASGKINCFANGILTSDRYGNLYPIVNMKYVKDGRTVRPYSEYEAVGIDRYWYDNLRLGENTETVEKSKEYVWKCLGQMLPLPAQS